MQLTIDHPEHANLIRGYSERTVTINEQTYQRSVVVMPHTLVTDWAPQSLAEL